MVTPAVMAQEKNDMRSKLTKTYVNNKVSRRTYGSYNVNQEILKWTIKSDL